MKFDVFGEKNNPVIIMLAGSFCSGKCLEYIYSKMCDEYYVIAPTYNGLYEGSEPFTTRQNEAMEIAKYLLKHNISCVKMIYGQSMGTEIGMELLRQLIEKNIKVEYAFFDGAPMIKLSRPYKAFMYFKFSSMVKIFKGKNIDDVMNMKFLKQFVGNKINTMKSLLEAVVEVAPFISLQTIKNQTECCYTFDFPQMSEKMQKNIYFYYGSDEKAYKTCYKKLKKYILMQGIK